MRTIDEILEQIGQMGRFQISRLAMFCFMMVAPAFQFLNMFFLAAEAPWQCAQNSTVCKLNGSFTVGDPDYEFRCKINRSDWEFAPYEGPHDSIVSEFDLVCDDAFYAPLATSMGYIGLAIFTIPLGALSDRFGRLSTLYPSYLLMIAAGLGSAFATDYWQFLVSRLLSNGMVNGVTNPISVLSAEFVGSRWRPLSQNAMWIAFTVELLILTLIAYFVRTWRTFAIICSAPWVITLVFAFFIPESIRWYSTHGKVDKAEKVLRKIAKTNRREYPDESRLKEPDITKEASQNYFALCSSWTLIKKIVIQSFVWFAIALVYYGSAYGASDFGGSMYFNFALSMLVEIPAHFIAVDNCERFGRKKSTMTYLIFGAIACFIVSLIPAGTQRTDFIAGRVISGMLGKCFVTICFDCVAVWSTELFPTVVRNSGMGVVVVFTCIGSACAPFVLELKRIHETLPFGMMGAVALLAALLASALPETKGKPTPEVLEDKNNGSMLLLPV